MSTAFAAPDGTCLPCTQHTELYWELDDVLDRPAPKPLRSHVAGLTQQARELCGGCPMVEQCLTQAVVGPDVSGYVGGTTPAERGELRKILGWKPDSNQFTRQECDNLPGVQVSTTRIDEALQQNPDWSNVQIAEVVGCSAHTVMRRRRKLESGAVTPRREPTCEEVLAAAALV